MPKKYGSFGDRGQESNLHNPDPKSGAYPFRLHGKDLVFAGDLAAHLLQLFQR